jgi:hypothetical protein
MKFTRLWDKLTPPTYARNMINIDAVLKNLTLRDNFGAQFFEELTLTSGQEISLPHSLKSTPKYRIIVRQRGNGLITDGSQLWTDTQIFFKNHGPDTVTFTVAILRG